MLPTTRHMAQDRARTPHGMKIYQNKWPRFPHPRNAYTLRRNIFYTKCKSKSFSDFKPTRNPRRQAHNRQSERISFVRPDYLIQYCKDVRFLHRARGLSTTVLCVVLDGTMNSKTEVTNKVVEQQQQPATNTAPRRIQRGLPAGNSSTTIGFFTLFSRAGVAAAAVSQTGKKSRFHGAARLVLSSPAYAYLTPPPSWSVAIERSRPCCVIERPVFRLKNAWAPFPLNMRPAVPGCLFAFAKTCST